MAGEINKRLKEIERDFNLKKLVQHAYTHFVSITPIDQGNARKSTTIQGTDTIHANYAYATRLDRGWSKQFKGQGMSKPTIEELQKYIKNNSKG
jgi:hypothetical protein